MKSISIVINYILADVNEVYDIILQVHIMTPAKAVRKLDQRRGGSRSFARAVINSASSRKNQSLYERKRERVDVLNDAKQLPAWIDFTTTSCSWLFRVRVCVCDVFEFFFFNKRNIRQKIASASVQRASIYRDHACSAPQEGC